MRQVQLLLVVLFLSFAACSSPTPQATNLNAMLTWVITPSIKAHIQDAWMDRSSHELYIWMVLD